MSFEIPDKFYKSLMYIFGGVILIMVYNKVYPSDNKTLYSIAFIGIFIATLMWIISSMFAIYRNYMTTEEEYYKTGKLKKKKTNDIGHLYLCLYGIIMLGLLLVYLIILSSLDIL